jgi:hypothetical protein
MISSHFLIYCASWKREIILHTTIVHYDIIKKFPGLLSR